jgi:hypothetical protein
MEKECEGENADESLGKIRKDIGTTKDLVQLLSEKRALIKREVLKYLN